MADGVDDSGDDRTDTERAGEPTVLVVDDEPSVRKSFSLYLDPLEYDVRTAEDVASAEAQLDEDVDIALLDRRMPDGSGDEILADIRARNLNCRVALVTAVDPDFDIVELDCDDYLVKPVDRDELVDTVERLAMLDEYDEKQRRLSNLRVKRNVLEVEKHPGALDESERFQRLQRRIDELEAELDDLESAFEAKLGFSE